MEYFKQQQKISLFPPPPFLWFCQPAIKGFILRHLAAITNTLFLHPQPTRYHFLLLVVRTVA